MRLDDAGADSTQFAHELLWQCAELAAEQPLALIVDDAQWADRLSLEVLAYLARRVEDLPLLIVLATRECDPQLSLLGTATVLHPAPLTAARRGAADRRTRRHGGRHDCHRATGGNPWLLAELGESAIAAAPVVSPAARSRGAAAAGGADPARPRRRRGAGGHRRRCGAPCRAAVAGIPVGELGPARDALDVAGLLAPGGSASRTR